MRTAVLLTLTAAAASTAALIPAGPFAAPPREAVAERRDVQRSPDLWATVNICDTARFPDRIGLRASMPGLGRRAKLFMRFRVHYLDPSDGRWRKVSENADTGFVRIGRTRRKVLEAGHTFRFLPPSGGGTHTLRGVVAFRWKAGGRVVERAREITESGHRSRMADPRNFSAAVCRIG